MALEQCPQCGEQISDKAKRCVHCGWERLPSEAEPSPAKCPDCGELIGGDSLDACPNCGCPLNGETDDAGEQPTKVEVTGVKVSHRARKTAVAVAVAVIVVAAIAVCAVLVNQQQAKQNEVNAYNEYIDNMTNVSQQMLSGAASAEAVCNKVSKIWNAAIFDNKKSWDSDISKYKSSDFNKAISNYYADSSTKSTISGIKGNQNTVDSLMATLKNPPSGLETAYETLGNMYEQYSKLTGLALSPSGNITQYNSNVGDADDGVLNYYKKLETQIPNKK